MKIKYEDQDIIEISEIDRLVLENDLISEDIEEDMLRRIKYVITHKIKQCEKRLMDEWVPELLNDPTVDTLPADRDMLIRKILNMPNYKNKKQRDASS